MTGRDCMSSQQLVDFIHEQMNTVSKIPFLRTSKNIFVMCQLKKTLYAMTKSSNLVSSIPLENCSLLELIHFMGGVGFALSYAHYLFR